MAEPRGHRIDTTPVDERGEATGATTSRFDPTETPEGERCNCGHLRQNHESGVADNGCLLCQCACFTANRNQCSGCGEWFGAHAFDCTYLPSASETPEGREAAPDPLSTAIDNLRGAIRVAMHASWSEDEEEQAVWDREVEKAEQRLREAALALTPDPGSEEAS